VTELCDIVSFNRAAAMRFTMICVAMLRSSFRGASFYKHIYGANIGCYFYIISSANVRSFM